MKSKLQSSARFISASALANMLAYSIFVLIEHFFHPKNHLVSLCVASLIVLPISYALNRFWVFESENRFIPEFARFLIIYALGLLISAILLYLILEIVGNVLLAQLASMVILGVAALLTHTFWTFIQKS